MRTEGLSKIIIRETRSYKECWAVNRVGDKSYLKTMINSLCVIHNCAVVWKTIRDALNEKAANLRRLLITSPLTSVNNCTNI